MRVLEREDTGTLVGLHAECLFPRGIIIIVGSRALRPPERIRQLMEFSTSGGWTPSATRRNNGLQQRWNFGARVEKFAVFVVLELKYLMELNCRVKMFRLTRFLFLFFFFFFFNYFCEKGKRKGRGRVRGMDQ